MLVADDILPDLSWLSLREAISLVARRLGYTEEYARTWIDREKQAGRLKSRRRTVKGWHALATDRDADELCADDLAAVHLPPIPKDEVAEGVRWTEAQAIAWAALGEPLELRNWPPEMDGKI